MTEPKHTPGPWKWEPDRDSYRGSLLASTGQRVIEFEQFSCGGGGEYPVCDSARLNISDADARLIAAAPEILEALENFVAKYVQIIASGDCGFWDPEKEQHVIDARAVIAKATGGQ